MYYFYYILVFSGQAYYQQTKPTHDKTHPVRHSDSKKIAWTS